MSDVHPAFAERVLRASLHTDGAARRKRGESTGPAGIGAVLRSESGEILGEIAKSIGIATNNVAEYSALVEGLQLAHEVGVTHLDAYVDSPVVAGHLLKGHAVRAEHLRPLIDHARGLLNLFSASSLTRVPRAFNGDADRLANKGIDDAIAKAHAAADRTRNARDPDDRIEP